MLHGQNNLSESLLFILGITKNDVPRFRDAFIHNDHIIIHTRTGGSNRAYYENKELYCEQVTKDNAILKEYGAEAEYIDLAKEDWSTHQWNEDLRKLPGYVKDEDDDFDSTYASFYYSFSADLKDDLLEIQKANPTKIPSERWKQLFKQMEDAIEIRNNKKD